MNGKKLTINGNTFPFQQGETILDVARRNHVDIPTLCHLAGTLPTGQCGVCVVQVLGEESLLKACETKAVNKMTVLTESRPVVQARKETLSRLLSIGNHNCAVARSDDNAWTQFQLKVQQEDEADRLCPVWGDCELQNLAFRYQAVGEKISTAPVVYPMETVNPFIVRDFSRCILCGRCVKACNEVQVNNAICFNGNETPDKVVTGAEDAPLKDSNCVFCGECIQACPVGALVEKEARYDVRPWDTEKVKTTCSYCGVGCQMYLHVKDNKVVKVTGASDTPPNNGSLCVKGRFGFHFIESPERLTTPLIRVNGELKEATWEEALDTVAKRLNRVKDSHGPDSIGVLTSARVTNEENFMAHKFARAVLKTNNIDHCARL